MLTYCFVSLLFSQSQSKADLLERVLNNLSYKVDIVGETVHRMNLSARMSHYRVPGISVTIVENSKIALSFSLGVKEVNTSEEITNRTLFLH